VLNRTTTTHLRTGVAPAAPAVIVLLLFFVVPTLLLFGRSIFEPVFGLQNYIELLGSGTYRKVLFNTFFVSTVVTAVTLVLGFPIAWLLAIMPRKWSAIVLGIILLSMWTNLLTRSFAWLVLLQTTGVINRGLMALGLISEPLPLVNNLTGVTIGMTYIMLPFVIMPIYATISALDASVFRAAALCGANRRQAFFHVLLPSAMPGIAAGGLMVFVMSLGYFVTPALLGGTSNMMLAEMIAGLIQSLLNWGLGSAAAFILLAITLAIFALQLRFVDPFGKSRDRS
jgi:putative spermidine/putrescine transport system permease protein